MIRDLISYIWGQQSCLNHNIICHEVKDEDELRFVNASHNIAILADFRKSQHSHKLHPRPFTLDS